MTISGYLKFSGASKAEFAKKIDVDLSLVYLYEQGKRKIPTPRTMLKIVQATGGLVGPRDFYPDAIALQRDLLDDCGWDG